MKKKAPMLSLADIRKHARAVWPEAVVGELRLCILAGRLRGGGMQSECSVWHVMINEFSTGVAVTASHKDCRMARSLVYAACEFARQEMLRTASKPPRLSRRKRPTPTEWGAAR